MRFGIQNPIIQTPIFFIVKQQPCIFQCFGEPEAFHVVLKGWRINGHILDGGVAERCSNVLEDGSDHFPAGLAPVVLAGYAVHVKDRFESFGTVDTG